MQRRIRQTRSFSPQYGKTSEGLLDALAVLAPHANVILTGDQYEKI
jgi:hypothetical protein